MVEVAEGGGGRRPDGDICSGVGTGGWRVIGRGRNGGKERNGGRNGRGNEGMKDGMKGRKGTNRR